jgi:hypothetical protein
MWIETKLSVSFLKKTPTDLQHHTLLVGGFNPSEKYEFLSWDYYSQYMESDKIHVPKPPTRLN